jgi:DtxR family transcriptional regulator, Mn-dependent transcriptional regulator
MAVTMSHLIDVPEMYLRTILELEEEGIVPLRARLVERLHLSGPSVSETVGRLEHEGLLAVRPDRTVQLTERGRERATSVMRKHRLAEVLLTEVIGLEWEQVHIEACRWEHVISDAVEERIDQLLGHPALCPHGNPIPGSAQVGVAAPGLLTAIEAAKNAVGAPVEVVVRRISEQLQVDIDAMRAVQRQGLMPAATVTLQLVDGEVYADGTAVSDEIARHLYVT